MRAFIVLLPVLLSISLHAQTPFAPVGAQWTYTQGSCCGPDSTIAVLQVLSDTVTQGRTCSHVTASSGLFGCYELIRYFSISNDSMYYFNMDDLQFHLLFRWDAVPGDSWSTPISQGSFIDTLDWSVTDTGHVVIGSVPLRTLTIAQNSRQGVLFCPLGGVITEQLGGSTPFTWVFGACDGETYRDLRCYDEYIFPQPEPPPPPPISWINPLYPQCALSTGIDETESTEWMTITPTILERGGSARITLDRSMPGNSALEMRDVTGRLLATNPVTGTSMTVTVMHPGLTLIALRTDGTLRAVQRVVVR